MTSIVFIGGTYDGTVTDNSPLHEGEDFQLDDGPIERYVRTDDVDESGHVVYAHVGTVH